MRRINPDKELNKIQNGNKNKVIVGLCTLLLIVVVGYSFALYQVRHTNKLVFNTVGEFKKRDIYLSVLVNGETQNEFPDKEDDYAFSGYECDGDATVTFDPDKWMASVNSNGPDKCTIKFGAKNINYDTLRIKEDILVDETNDANLRYIGANPSNYIWFNCDDYENLTQEEAVNKCERWRIIGIMNNMTIVDEDTNEETKNHSLVKIIRAESIGNIAWNKDNVNDWTNASLKKGLNGPYLENEDDGAWINLEEYTGSENSNQKKDNYKGITANTKGIIEEIKWNIGGYANSADLKTKQFYVNERGTLAYNSHPTIWTGKIGLLYPSDYGYSTSGGDFINRNTCLEKSLNSWQDDQDNKYKTECAENSWIWDSSFAKWSLTSSNKGNVVYHVADWGSVSNYFSIGIRGVFPTLYLKPTTQITSGQGTFEEPYIIVNNS